MKQTMEISLCPTPALYEYYKPQGSFIAIVVDILRASTSMLAAFEAGVRSIIPVASIEEAKAYADQGFLVAAERNTLRLDFADFGNDPREFTKERLLDRDLVFTSSNGTEAIRRASDADEVLVAAYSNLQAVANYLANAQKPILVVAAGWQSRMSIEDCIYAGALKNRLETMGLSIHMKGDETRLMDRLWKEYGSDEQLFFDFMQKA